MSCLEESTGRVVPLCPNRSDINLFRYCQGVIHLDAEISDSAFYFRVAEQELHGSQVAGSSVDECCFCPPQRMRAKELGAQCWQSILKEAARIAAWSCTGQSRADP
jgi:hypothetical protein